VVEYLLSTCKALGLISSTGKKNYYFELKIQLKLIKRRLNEQIFFVLSVFTGWRSSAYMVIAPNSINFKTTPSVATL
jgi:hypothetical protein